MKKWIICGLTVLCALLLAVGYGKRGSGFPTREEIAAMTDQQAAEVLAGTSQEALRKAWGEPVAVRSDVYGDVYAYDGPGGCIVVHYDVRFDSGPRVAVIHIS